MTSIVIPAYYATQELVEITAKCLRSLHLTELPDQIILVDDGSPIQATQDFSDIDIRLPENQGYSAAVNAGLEAAQGDIIIVGNNDLTFHENWLTELLRVLDEGFDVATCWTSDQKYKLQDKIEQDAKFGSIFAMKREVYEQVGGFDEQFRGYFADDDLRKRMLEAGFTIGKNCNLVIEHLAKATYDVTDPDDEEYQRAKILFEIKHGLE